MKIKVVMPDKAMDRETLDKREIMLKAAVSDGTEISVDCIKKGPDELDCNTDEAFAAAELVKEARRAEKEGYDARKRKRKHTGYRTGRDKYSGVFYDM